MSQTPRRVVTSLLALALAPAGAGCSALYAKDDDGGCSTSDAPVVGDVVLGILALGSGGTGVLFGAGLEEPGMAALGAVGLLGATAHFVAAGNNGIEACRRERAGLPPLAPREAPRREGNHMEVSLHGTYRDGDYHELGGGTVDAQITHRGYVTLGLATSHTFVEEAAWESYGGPDRDQYTITSLAPRLSAEPYPRTAEGIGLGLRLRPAWSWVRGRASGNGEAWGGQPLVAAVIGSTSMWVDLGWGEATALDDARGIHYQIGWRTSTYEALTGLVVARMDDVSLVWATQVEVPIDGWLLGARVELGDSLALGLSLGYHFGL